MDETNNNMNTKRKGLLLFGIVTFGILCLIFLFLYLHYKATHIATDNAFVEGRIHVIASKVGGTVKTIHVRDNQPVKKGDLLIEIDEVDYNIKVKEASTALETEKVRLSETQNKSEAAKKQLQEIKASVDTAKANVELQDSNVRQAKLDMKRAENLFKNDAISKERYEKTQTALEVSEAQLKAAREHVKQLEASQEAQLSIIKQAEAAITTQSATIKQRQTLLEGSLLNKSYVKIYTPTDGYVTKKSVEVGNQISIGLPLLAVVPLDDIWIVANYKETQLQKIKPGHKVKIQVDAYSKKTLTGVVDSIMAGTGTTFSLFPPENATGNYVKVVQRIPVKIILDKDTDKEQTLRIGMSVIPTVIVR